MNLDIKQLTRAFGGLKAVDEVNMSVPERTIHALIGPNGAGKTTVINMISGFYKPTSGQIVFGEQSIGGWSTSRVAQAGIGRTFQNVRLFKELTVLDNVLLGQHVTLRENPLGAIFGTPGFRSQERSAVEKAQHLLELIGLQERQRVQAKHLPYGQQKVLEIARALGQKPRLLLLDEPAAGLNPTESDDLQQLVHRLNEQGLTILLIEHDMNFVMSLAKEITVLSFGKVIANGTPAEIRQNAEVIEAYLGKGSAHAKTAAN